MPVLIKEQRHIQYMVTKMESKVFMQASTGYSIICLTNFHYFITKILKSIVIILAIKHFNYLKIVNNFMDYSMFNDTIIIILLFIKYSIVILFTEVK